MDSYNLRSERSPPLEVLLAKFDDSSETLTDVLLYDFRKDHESFRLAKLIEHARNARRAYEVYKISALNAIKS